MDWIVFSVSSVFLFSLASILRRVVMKDDKTDAIASSIVFQFLGAVFIGMFAFSQGFVLPQLTGYYLNYLFVGVFWGLATFFQFKAYHYLEASEAIIISTLEAVVIIIAAKIFLSEIFTLPMVIGTLLVLAGVIIVTKTKHKMQFNRGVLYALGFCLFAGLGAVNDTYMVKSVDAMSYLSIGFLLPALFLMIIQPKAIIHIKALLPLQSFRKIVLLTLFYSLGAILFVFAILHGAQVSQLGVIANSSVILTVLLATLFLGERDNLLRKCLATILVFVGVILLR
ncbi:MAG TPA: DMT family transporter [Patescibacteria group bacterium]|nr:DMT family transporter [Patescibacteria group bacterium]